MNITQLIIIMSIAWGLITLLVALAVFSLHILKKRQLQIDASLSLLSQHVNQLNANATQVFHQISQQAIQFSKDLQQESSATREQLNQTLHQSHIQGMQQILNSLQQYMSDTREQIALTLKQQTHQLSQRFEHLTQDTGNHLREIGQLVHTQLTAGFEKTTATFNDVIKRLAIIDQAQQKITELSSDVVSLQTILADKRSRGAFGEVQLAALISNVLPEKHYAFQYTLSNGKRVDCILFLPEPTGYLTIDAKFPLETYQHLNQTDVSQSEKVKLEQQFRQDIRKHIQSIAQKYIIKGETADGAMMFIPAEAIFAEIHGNYPDLVEMAHREKVWLVSPTTMMAILTTAHAVLKDAATREQIHLIQEHLTYLSKDFQRFQDRMNNLARHIQQANHDVDEINTSAKKISQRFNKIERVELKQEQTQALDKATND